MNFDDLKIIWDDDNRGRSYTIDEDALHRIVVKRAQSFRKKIFWRDLREIGLTIPLVAFFLWRGIHLTLKNEGSLFLTGWGLILMSAGLIIPAAYVYARRLGQKRRDRRFEVSINGNLQKLISNVGHQIRLLNSVFWWGILPIIPGFIIVIVGSAELNPINPFIRLLIGLVIIVVIYGLNKRAVRTYLIPQKKELESLLVRLDENGDKPTES